MLLQREHCGPSADVSGLGLPDMLLTQVDQTRLEPTPRRWMAHLHADLAVLAEIGFCSGDPRLGQFERGNRGIRGPVPQFGSDRSHPQHADIRIVRSALPHVIGALPNLGRLGVIAPHLRACGDREIGFGPGVDEDQAHIVLGLDLVLRAAANIGDEPDQAGIAFRPRLYGPGAQAARKLRRRKVR